MTFHNVRFPTRISYGATGGPRFSTTVQLMNSGHEQRNINWVDARREYEFDVTPAREESWRELLAFFHARRGRAYGFRLKDFADFKLAEEPIGTGDGVATSFQITKTYAESGAPAYGYVRKLTRIVAGTAAFFFSGAQQIGNWTLDDNTGVVTFMDPPADGVQIEVSCEFDVPVRFDTDLMAAAFAGPDSHEWHQVKLLEIRE